MLDLINYVFSSFILFLFIRNSIIINKLKGIFYILYFIQIVYIHLICIYLFQFLQIKYYLSIYLIIYVISNIIIICNLFLTSYLILENNDNIPTLYNFIKVYNIHFNDNSPNKFRKFDNSFGINIAEYDEFIMEIYITSVLVNIYSIIVYNCKTIYSFVKIIYYYILYWLLHYFLVIIVISINLLKLIQV